MQFTQLKLEHWKPVSWSIPQVAKMQNILTGFLVLHIEVPRSPGLVNFVSAVAYHFCQALPAAFTQPGDHLLDEPCRYIIAFKASSPLLRHCLEGQTCLPVYRRAISARLLSSALKIS